MPEFQELVGEQEGHGASVETPDLSTLGSSWSQQRHFYEEECDPEFEINRPHNCGRLYEFLIEHKFSTGRRLLNFDLVGISVLEVCCGSGMMSEKFARAGARVTGIDLSEAAISRARERSRRHGFRATFIVDDAENLSFPSGAFDVVAVHDGLHHLENQERAVREMARVARRAVLILDPAEAVLTKLAVLLGIAVNLEEAGNRVNRLSPNRVATILRKEGFERLVYRRTLMYYPHKPNRLFMFFSGPILFLLLKACFMVINKILGQFGNKLALAAMRI